MESSQEFCVRVAFTQNSLSAHSREQDIQRGKTEHVFISSPGQRLFKKKKVCNKFGKCYNTFLPMCLLSMYINSYTKWVIYLTTNMAQHYLTL